MISAWWLLGAYFVGTFTGIFLIALVSGNREGND